MFSKSLFNAYSLVIIQVMQRFDVRVTQQPFLATSVFVSKQLFRDSPIITLVTQVCGYDVIK